MAKHGPIGISGLIPGNIGPTADLPLLRGKLKTIKQRASQVPPSAGTTGASGAPNVDTFARTGVPNVTYTLRHRAQ